MPESEELFTPVGRERIQKLLEDPQVVPTSSGFHLHDLSTYGTPISDENALKALMEKSAVDALKRFLKSTVVV